MFSAINPVVVTICWNVDMHLTESATSDRRLLFKIDVSFFYCDCIFVCCKYPCENNYNVHMIVEILKI